MKRVTKRRKGSTIQSVTEVDRISKEQDDLNTQEAEAFEQENLAFGDDYQFLVEWLASVNYANNENPNPVAEDALYYIKVKKYFEGSMLCIVFRRLHDANSSWNGWSANMHTPCDVMRYLL